MSKNNAAFAVGLERLRQQAWAFTHLPEPGEGRTLRLQAGLSRRELANIIGVSARSLIWWENGSRVPRGENRLRYAEVVEQLRNGDLFKEPRLTLAASPEQKLPGPERDAYVLEEVCEGSTFVEIGRRLEISGERVRQLYDRASESADEERRQEGLLTNLSCVNALVALAQLRPVPAPSEPSRRRRLWRRSA